VWEILFAVFLAGMGLYAGHRPRPRYPAPAAPPVLGPYRDAEEPPPVNEPFVIPEPTGPYHCCPQCGAPAQRCDKCYDVRTDKYQRQLHIGFVDSIDKPCGVYREQPDVFLAYTHGTSLLRLCTPQQRVWMSWWHRERCESHGLHVHQKCQRCGWRGVAYVGRMQVS
jgi:hypothetical protein